MTQDDKRWLAERIAQDPEFFCNALLPAIDRSAERADSLFRNAARSSDFPQIKYHMGVLDGLRELDKIVSTLRTSSSSKDKSLSASGLISRIFSKETPNPAEPG